MQATALARLGRFDEAARLTERAHDMDEEDAGCAALGKDYARIKRAESLAKLHLAAGRPRLADAVVQGAREYYFPQLLYARVRHANGVALQEAEMAFVRHYVTDYEGRRQLQDLRGLERVERAQARLSGRPPVPVPRAFPTLTTDEADTRGHALWRAIPA